MIDRNKESLSAFMDGEADELEARRIINQLDKDDGLRENWKNYHLIGSLMRDEGSDSLDLTSGINKALDSMENAQPDDFAAPDSMPTSLSSAPLKTQAENPIENQQQVQVAKRSWYRPLTSVAVAASVTLAVLVGVQSIEPNDGFALASANKAAMQPSGELTASTVTQEEHQSLTLEQQKDLQSAQQQLQEYVLKQSQEGDAGRSGMLPFARVVEFEGQAKQ